MACSPRAVARRRTQATNSIKSRSKSKKKEEEDDTICEECRSGEFESELLLCDQCDRGFHLFCLRPILASVPIGSWFCPSCSTTPKTIKRFPLAQTKIVDFFRIQRTSQSTENGCQDTRKRRRKASSLGTSKKKRRLLPFTPSDDSVRRLQQMASLATALTATGAEFSNDLTYNYGMAPKLANCPAYEKEGMQAEMINLRGEGVLSDQDIMEKVLGSSRGHSRGVGRKLSSASCSSSSVSSKRTRNVAPSVEQYMTTWFQALKAANPGIVIPDIPNFNGSCAEGEDMGDENEEGNLNDEDENEEGDENDEEDENDEDA